MTPTTEVKPKPSGATVEEFPLATKLVHATFVSSIPFGVQASSVQVGRNCDSIVPARMEADGSLVSVEKGQRADGLMIRKRVHHLTTHAKTTAQTFVPWANIVSVDYGAE